MKKFFLLVFLVLMLMSCSCSTSGLKVSYSDDDVVTQSRNLRGFEKVEIIGSPTVYYSQADSFSVRVTGPGNIVDNIITDVDGGTLVIRNKGKMGVVNVNFGNSNKLAVYVTSPDLVGVLVSGSGDFVSGERIDTDIMDVRLKGSGDVKFADILCDRCDVEIVGSGDVDIKRLDTREASATLIGSGDVDIRMMNATSTHLQLRGSGDIDIDFMSGCGSVDAELLGSGDISLKGRVKTLNKQRRGSGDIDTDKLRIE